MAQLLKKIPARKIGLLDPDHQIFDGFGHPVEQGHELAHLIESGNGKSGSQISLREGGNHPAGFQGLFPKEKKGEENSGKGGGDHAKEKDQCFFFEPEPVKAFVLQLEKQIGGGRAVESQKCQVVEKLKIGKVG
jgi:hypothetical protein